MNFENKLFLVDEYEHPQDDLIYSPISVPGKGANVEELESQLLGCGCSEDISCLVSSPCKEVHLCEQNYTLDKLLLEGKWSFSGVVECNAQCSCSVEKCTNRVVQFGPRKCLEVFWTGDKGLGLKSQNFIPKGAFICEYAGELIGKDEAKRRFGLASASGYMNYIFVLREIITSPLRTNIIETIVDPSVIGNIGRYINHSCDPNSGIVPVRVDSPVPKLGIFAKCNILPGEEITYNYSGGCGVLEDDDNTTIDKKPCFCGAQVCKRFLPYDVSLV